MKETYIGVQVNIDGLNYIERKIPDYTAFDYIVKVTQHVIDDFGNWHNTYEVYDKNQNLAGIKFNGWETSSYFKQDYNSWKGGSISKTDIKDNKDNTRIVNFKEINFASIAREYTKFESMMDDLIKFFKTFLDWDEYDKNNKSKTKDDEIAELKKENDKMKNLINQIQQLLRNENVTNSNL